MLPLIVASTVARLTTSIRKPPNESTAHLMIVATGCSSSMVCSPSSSESTSACKAYANILHISRTGCANQENMETHDTAQQCTASQLYCAIVSVCAELHLAMWYWRKMRGERRALQQESPGEVLFAKSPQALEDLAALPVYIPATPFERCSSSEGSDIGTVTDHLQSTYTAFYMHYQCQHKHSNSMPS